MCSSSARKPCPIQVGWTKIRIWAETVVYDGTLRNLELIGEAATHIPGEVREAHQWRRTIATRNHLAHSNLGMDDDVIWDIIRTDVPKLLTALRKLLETTNEDSP